MIIDYQPGMQLSQIDPTATIRTPQGDLYVPQGNGQYQLTYSPQSLGGNALPTAMPSYDEWGKQTYGSDWNDISGQANVQQIYQNLLQANQSELSQSSPTVNLAAADPVALAATLGNQQLPDSYFQAKTPNFGALWDGSFANRQIATIVGSALSAGALSGAGAAGGAAEGAAAGEGGTAAASSAAAGPLGTGIGESGSSLGTGAAGGVAASTAGNAGTVPETLPTQLSGPGVTNAGTTANSSAATDAAFGSGGPTQIAPAGTGTGGGIGGGLATGAGSAVAGSALSRILDGSATGADYASVLGQAAPSVLGYLGSQAQTTALQNLYNQQLAIGAPSRARYEASMTPGFDPTSIPGYQGAIDTSSNALLRNLSASGGNPYGNPGGLIEANKQIIQGTALPALQQYQNQNAATGGYNAFNTAAPGTANAGIASEANQYNAIGAGLGAVLNPQPSLLQTLQGLRGALT